MEYTPRRKLTREFKLEAVRQTALSEKPKAQVARELGVRVGQLRTWRLEFEKEAVTGIAKPERSVTDDLEQLRRENAKLKMEIEILKKAAIYFVGKRSEIRLRRKASTAVRRAGPVRSVGGLAQRILRSSAPRIQ
jgi:transposase